MKYLSGFYNNAIFVLLFLVAFAPILNDLTGVKFAGFSFFITVLPSLLLYLIYLLNYRIFTPMDGFLLLINLLFFGIVIFLRGVFYGEFSLKIIGVQSYMFSIPISLQLFQYIKFDSINVKKLFYLLIVILIFNFTIALLHMLGLPTIEYVNIDSPDYVEFSRYTGLFSGSNGQGVFVSTIFLILILGPFKLNLIKRIFLFIIAFLAVLPTISRNAILQVLFVFLFSLYDYFKTANALSRVGFVATLCLIIFSVSSYIDTGFLDAFFNSFFSRFETDDLSGGRIDKILFALNTLFENIEYILIGIPGNKQENATISISDNSLILIVVSFGIPFFLYFLYFISNFHLGTIKIKRNLIVYIILVLIILITNNAVLWFSWSLFAIMGYCLLRAMAKSETRPSLKMESVK